MRASGLGLVALYSLGCGSAPDSGADGQATPVDAAAVDANTSDGSAPDGGLPDGGLPDGALLDGMADAGSPDGALSDAGQSDAGAVDAGTADAGVTPPDPITPIWCGALHSGGDILLDLGHAAHVAVLEQFGTRVLSRDDRGHWVLWDTTSRLPVVSGEVERTCSPFCPFYLVDLVGGALFIQGPGVVTIRDAIDGHVMTVVATTASHIGLAQDGSYLWAASPSGLSAWSLFGMPLVARTGDYSNSKVYAAVDELRIAAGPAGANSIEVVAISDGSSTITPAFSGDFHSWFIDGGRFITNIGNAVRIYSKEAVLAQFLSLETLQDLTGQGNHFWIRVSSTTPKLKIFPVGGSVPAEYPDPALTAVAGTLLATAREGYGVINFLELGGASIVETQQLMPDEAYGVLAIDEAGNWSTRGYAGVVYESTHVDGPDGPLPLSCGVVYGIAGSASGQVAISTATNRIMFLDVRPGMRALLSVVPMKAWRMQMSDDGSVLVGESGPVQCCDDEASSLHVLSMPDGSPLAVWPWYGQLGWPIPGAFALARSSDRIATREGPAWDWLVTDLTATSTYFAVDTGNAPGSLSPDGRLLAVNSASWEAEWDSAALIYDDTGLIGATTGFAIGWIDDSRLLLQDWPNDSYNGMAISDPLGNILEVLPIPRLARFTTVDATHIYSPEYHAIYAIPGGGVSWSTPESPFYPSNGNGYGYQGDIADAYVVHEVRHRIRIDPY